jgi:hypothetical protein
MKSALEGHDARILKYPSKLEKYKCSNSKIKYSGEKDTRYINCHLGTDHIENYSRY